MGSFAQSNAEIIWFYIPMYEMSVVDIFYPRDHLIDQHQNSLEGELAKGLVEEGLKGRTHQIHY